MSPGFATYLVFVVLTLAMALRTATEFSQALKARGRGGLLGYDPDDAELLRSPIAALRRARLTQSWLLATRPIADDPELERKRRLSLNWALAAAAVTLFGLPLI